jgi:hypothetical protein
MLADLGGVAAVDSGADKHYPRRRSHLADRADQARAIGCKEGPAGAITFKATLASPQRAHPFNDYSAYDQSQS